MLRRIIMRRVRDLVVCHPINPIYTPRRVELTGAASRTLFVAEDELRLTHRKAIVTGKHQVYRPPLFAHPLRRQAVRLAGTNIPRVGEIDGRPRPPRLSTFINPKTAVESAI